MSTQRANSVKLITIILILLGMFVPFWPISLPVFWFLAYRSYKGGVGNVV